MEKLVAQEIFEKLEEIDYYGIIDSIPVIVVIYERENIANKYKLHRESKSYNIKKVYITPSLLLPKEGIDFTSISAQSFEKELKEFVQVLVERFPVEDLTFFYNNLSNLKIMCRNFKLANIINKENFTGSYDIDLNTVEVLKKDFLIAIFHELFHMSSTYNDGVVVFSGFSQSTDEYIIGDGINEAYTQILTERYFGHIKKVKDNYTLEKNVINHLEKIIGKEKMESMYLKADLKGLINCLQEFTSLNDIMTFINFIDFFLIYGDEYLKLNNKDEYLIEIEDKLEYVYKFLLTIFIEKLIKTYEYDSNYKEKIDSEYEDFVNSLDAKGYLRVEIIEEIKNNALNKKGR